MSEREFIMQMQPWFGDEEKQLLNEYMDSGGLRFDSLQYTYQPEAGDLVFFPSGHRYLHQALPVEKGIKYAIVTWMAVQGSDRVGLPPGLKLSPVRD